MAEKLTFEQGYICAVAALVAMHGAGAEAHELLHAAGKVDWSRIDKHDRDILQKAGLYKPNKVVGGRVLEASDGSM